MIHHIKSLYAEGEGLTIRAIAQQLKVSRNTVRKYLRLDEAEIGRRQDDRSRSKRLDEHRDFIVQLSILNSRRPEAFSVHPRTYRRILSTSSSSPTISKLLPRR